MIYKLVSAKAVIGKIYRDFKPTIPGWEASAIEWIGEAAEAIGQSAGLIQKSTGNVACFDACTIVSHRAKLPCDLVNLQAVEYNGARLPFGSDLTAGGLPNHPRTTNIYTNSGTTASIGILAGNSKSTAKVATGAITLEGVVTDYYIINPDYIQTSFESGHIKLHYEAYPTCPDGFPMIPDHYYYKTAAEWYVMEKLFLLGYSNPAVDYKIAHQFWCEYKILAQNKAAFPSIDKMDRFHSMWTRLIPNTVLPKDFFAGGETTESIKYV